MYKLYQYNDTNFRLICTKSDYISTNEKKIKKDDYYVPQTEDEEIQRISLSRSKRMIREYSLCNEFTYFFTSTVNSELADRYSLSETQSRIRKIMKSIKRKNKDFLYLFITERHKDGAFHFHGLCTDLELYTNKNGYFSSKDFDKLGFNSFSKIRDREKTSNYITKYITKDCVKNEQGSVYFCSKGLKKSYSYEIQPICFDKLGMNVFQNDFCKIVDYNVKKLSQEQLLYLSNNLKERDTIIDILRKKLADKRN